MHPLTLPAARGWRWLADGFRLFRQNHLMLTFLIVSYWMLMALVNVTEKFAPGASSSS